MSPFVLHVLAVLVIPQDTTWNAAAVQSLAMRGHRRVSGRRSAWISSGCARCACAADDSGVAIACPRAGACGLGTGRGIPRASDGRLVSSAADRPFQQLRLPDQRRQKVALDSLRRAGNAAMNQRGFAAALPLWRESARRADALGDTRGYRRGDREYRSRLVRRRRTRQWQLPTSTARPVWRGWQVTSARRATRWAAWRMCSATGVTLPLRVRSTSRPAGSANVSGTCEAMTRGPQEQRHPGRAPRRSGRSPAGLRVGGRAKCSMPVSRNRKRPVERIPVSWPRYAETSPPRSSNTARHSLPIGGLAIDPTEALVLRSQGLMELRRGDYNQARALLNSALTIYSSTGPAAKTRRCGTGGPRRGKCRYWSPGGGTPKCRLGCGRCRSRAGRRAPSGARGTGTVLLPRGGLQPEQRGGTLVSPRRTALSKCGRWAGVSLVRVPAGAICSSWTINTWPPPHCWIRPPAPRSSWAMFAQQP